MKNVIEPLCGLLPYPRLRSIVNAEKSPIRMRLSLRRFATYGPRDAMIVGAVRTPSGALLGALSSLKATELGSHVIQHAVQRSGVPAAQVEEVLFGRWLVWREAWADV